MRRRAFFIVLFVVLAGTGTAWAYVPPVAGPITDPFRAPKTVYGPGNEGIDYSPSPGTPVQASDRGQVSFAGQVGGQLFVVVTHPDGIRTTYGYLASITVHTGQNVNQGEEVGTAGKDLHFGARIGSKYIDPTTLFGEKVHLVPLDGR